jgi:two-component system, NtrC family, response regulator AtoC
VGGIKPRRFDIRFIAATNRDLVQGVETGTFRADLFYRLNGISLVIPPLRQRSGEIEELAKRFVSQGVEKAGRPDVPTISVEAMRWLRAHTWPGNIRELQNTMERAVLLCTGSEITPEHLPTQNTAPVPAVSHGFGDSPEDGDPERRRILDALESCAGNQTRAAKLLGISRNTLLARLDTYGIKRPRKPVR